MHSTRPRSTHPAQSSPAWLTTVLATVAFTCALSPGSSAQPACAVDVAFALDALEEQCGKLIAAKRLEWKKIRREFAGRARRVEDDDGHHLLLIELVARLRDGHAYVRAKSKRPPRSLDRSGFVGPGMFWFEAKKKVFVRNAWGQAKKAGIEPGMEIVLVDGQPVRRWLEAREDELATYRSFSTDHHARFYTLQRGLAAKAGSRLALVAKKSRGTRKKYTVLYRKDHCVPFGPAVPPKGLQWAGKNIAYGTSPEGFGYLHVRRCRPDVVEELDTALGALGSPKGLILDFRGNSGGRFDHAAFLGRFVPAGKTLTFASKTKSAGPHQFGGPVVVIVNATCASAGETASGMFKEEGRGYVIGESPTAGMSSQKTTIELPSKRYALYVSTRTNKSWYNGRRGLEGIGVLPHETKELDPRDVAAGRDTLITRAEALLKKFPRKAVPYRPKQFGWKAPK